MAQRRIFSALIFFLILCSSFSFGLESYPNTGGSDSDFVLGTGQWNVGLDDFNSFTKTMSNPKFIPLVEDLDGDGTNEIVVFDNNQIRIFRNSILTPVDSFTLPTADVYSPPIIFDVSVSPINPAQSASINVSASKDSYLLESSPTLNFGSSSSLLSDRLAGGLSRPLLSFDLSFIPSNAVITLATLNMNTTAEAGATYVIEAHRMTSDWSENGVTWNLKDGTNTWTASGGDFDSAFTYATANAPDGAVTTMSMNITQLAQQWVSGIYPNYGVILDEQATGATAIKTFKAREALGAFSPKLFVSYTIPSSSGVVRKEILVGSYSGSPNTNKVSILNYNGSVISSSLFTLFSGSATNPFEMFLSCQASNDCVAIWSENPSATSVDRTRAILFNSTNVTGSVIDVRTSTTERGCFPLIPVISHKDIDNDGLGEYVYSQIYTSDSAADASNDDIRVFILNKTGNDQVSKQLEFSVGTFNLVDVAKGVCTTSTGLGAGDYPIGKYVSSPLVYNFDGASGNGLEIVLAYSKTPTTYEMASYSPLGVQIDTYPEIQTADGRILSNPIRTNAFPDTGENDFCTLGFKQDTNTLDLICASMLTGNTPQTEEFMFSNSFLENYSTSYQYYNAIIHSVKDSSDLTDGNNLDELLMLYGTFDLIWDVDITPLNFVDGDNSLGTQWNNPLQGGSILQIDAEGVGKDDMLVLTPTNLWYFDDGFVNSNAQIDYYQVNPCIDRTWKVNTSVSIQLRAQDSDGDDIRYKAIFYSGDSNVQDSGYTAYLASGTIASFTFKANKTIGTSNIRLLAHDREHPLTDDEVDVSFSVSSTGAELNDCTTIVNLALAGEGSNDTASTSLGVEPLDKTDNVIINPIRLIGEFTKLGVLGTFLLLIIALNIYVLVEKRDLFGAGNNMRYVLVILGVIDILLIILGTILSIIPFGIVIIFVIIGLLILAFAFKDKLGGSGV